VCHGDGLDDREPLPRNACGLRETAPKPDVKVAASGSRIAMLRAEALSAQSGRTDAISLLSRRRAEFFTFPS